MRIPINYHAWQKLQESSAPRQVISHLTHLEDLVWTQYGKGAATAAQFLEQVAGVLAGNADQAINLSVKFDGAPSIVCGRDPADGKFFISTKSVFAKTPRVAKSIADIQQLYGHAPGLVETLTTAYNALSQLNWTTILQGDLLFVPSLIKKQTVDGVPHITFKPNTITYGIPESTPLGQRVLAATVGVAFHTTYTGTSLSTLRASAGAAVNRLGASSSVLLFPTRYQDVSGTALLTVSERQQIDTLIRQIKTKSARLRGNAFLRALEQQTAVRDLLMQYQNSLVRSGQPITLTPKQFASGFNNFLQSVLTTQQRARKSVAGKQTVQQKFGQFMQMVQQLAPALEPIIEWQQDVITAKTTLMNKLNLRMELSTFISSAEGLTRGSHEGFVASDHDGKFVKLVDRSGFSQLNLTQGRFR